MADIERKKLLDESNLKDFVKTLIQVMEEKGVGGGTGGGSSSGGLYSLANFEIIGHQGYGSHIIFATLS